MINRAIDEYPGVLVENAPSDNITYKLLSPLINKRYADDELWYILGSDLLEHLPSWDDVDKMLERMNICVVLRSNKDKSASEAILHKLQSQHKNLRYELLPEVWSHISSSKIRHHIQENGTSDDVPPSVMNYIKQNLLY